MRCGVYLMFLGKQPRFGCPWCFSYLKESFQLWQVIFPRFCKLEFQHSTIGYCMFFCFLFTFMFLHPSFHRTRSYNKNWVSFLQLQVFGFVFPKSMESCQNLNPPYHCFFLFNQHRYSTCWSISRRQEMRRYLCVYVNSNISSYAVRFQWTIRLLSYPHQNCLYTYIYRGHYIYIYIYIDLYMHTIHHCICMCIYIYISISIPW